MNLSITSDKHIKCGGLTALLLALVFSAAGWQAASAQKITSLNLADKYFANGDYYTAAGLYEQYLNPDNSKNKKSGMLIYNSITDQKSKAKDTRPRLDIVYKLAESYRLSHYFSEAATRYKECYDSSANTYPGALYWYAVCQRSLGNYPAAEEILNRFLKNHATESPLKLAAEFEKQTLDFIRTQMNRADTALYLISKADAAVGIQKGLYAPVGITANQYLVTSTTKDSLSKGNPYHNRLFYADNNNRSLQNLQLVYIDSLDQSQSQGTAALGADGQTLYLTQWIMEAGKSRAKIYFSKKQGQGWSKPSLLPTINGDGYSNKQPSVSADGKTIYFVSDRPGGFGGNDIWFATLETDGLASEPINAGQTINTNGDEQSPYFHDESNSLVFASNGRVGMGGYDLYMAKKTGDQWEEAKNLGYPVNSSRDDIYFFAAKGSLLKEGYFCSDRGSDCCLETYTIEKLPRKKVLTGKVLACSGEFPVEEAEVEMPGVAKVKTDLEGYYSMELSEEDIMQNKLIIRKERFKDKETTVPVIRFNESDLLTDTLYSESACMDKILVVKPEEVIIVYFDFDKSDLTAKSKFLLDSVYGIVSNYPRATIQISGYTDGKGTALYNTRLSDKRTMACSKYLISKGINPSLITFESFGECCPVEEEMINGKDNPEARRKNRRALINIMRD
jgi:OOP family OmpA-OmpF porin